MIFVYYGMLHHSRRELHLGLSTLSTVSTLAAMHPSTVLKDNNAVTASPEPKTAMSAVMLTAGHAEDVVAADDLAGV